MAFFGVLTITSSLYSWFYFSAHSNGEIPFVSTRTRDNSYVILLKRGRVKGKHFCGPVCINVQSSRLQHRQKIFSLLDDSRIVEMVDLNLACRCSSPLGADCNSDKRAKVTDHLFEVDVNTLEENFEIYY